MNRNPTEPLPIASAAEQPPWPSVPGLPPGAAQLLLEGADAASPLLRLRLVVDVKYGRRWFAPPGDGVWLGLWVLGQEVAVHFSPAFVCLNRLVFEATQWLPASAIDRPPRGDWLLSSAPRFRDLAAGE